MRTLTVTAFLTLDGVMQAPGGPDEDTDGGFEHGGWLVPLFDEEMGRFIDASFAGADAFLLGRRTYEIFARHWPHVTDPEDTVAAKLNALPKYVASTTLTDPGWAGTTVVSDVVGTVTSLKSAGDGELQVHGSCELLQTLIAHDLVDEYRLLVAPVVLGQGKRLFREGAPASTLSLVESRVSGSGVLLQTYRPTGKVEHGHLGLEYDD